MADRVIFDGCVIEWVVSEHCCQFLDAFLYKENSKLQWKPFVKAGNNRERIPWVSHHPLDVKRGTFVGEMSRLATLSTRYETYLEALQSLTSLYVKRGYPFELLKNWLKLNINKRWDSQTPNFKRFQGTECWYWCYGKTV